MRKTVILLVLIAVLCGGATRVSAAGGIVHDPLNYTINLLRNAMSQAQHALKTISAAKRLVELKNLFTEFSFMNQALIKSGFSEISSVVNAIKSFRADPARAGIEFADDFTGGFFESLAANPLFHGTPGELAHLNQFINRADSGTLLAYYLNSVPDPLAVDLPYITYEQAQIARTFDQAESLREYAKEIGEEGVRLAEQAQGANLLGAARLEVASSGKLYEILGVMITTQARLAELQSISIEQVSRQEKMGELARQKLIHDGNAFAYGEESSFNEIL